MNIRRSGFAQIIGLTAALGTIIPAHAQRSRPVAVVADDNSVTVHGHAILRSKPDIAYATIAVTTHAATQDKAVSANATRVKALISTLKQDGIPDKDIQTQYYTVQPQYDYTPSPPVRTGYEVQNAVRVTIRNLTKAGQILDHATTAGATDVSSLSFDIANKDGIQGQALAAAVANARSKADLLAGAAGVSIGRVLSVTEDSAPMVTPLEFNMARKSTMAAADTTPIQPQEISVTADVTLSYSITANEK